MQLSTVRDRWRPMVFWVDRDGCGGTALRAWNVCDDGGVTYLAFVALGAARRTARCAAPNAVGARIVIAEVWLDIFRSVKTGVKADG